MKIKYWITVAFIVGIVGLAMPVTTCANNYNPIFESYLNGCALGCTSAQDGDADYHTTYSYDFAAGDPIDSTEIKCCIVRNLDGT